MKPKTPLEMRRPRPPVHIEPKVWGREVWIANGPLYCGKILELRQGMSTSLHYHKRKTESFYLHCGRLRIRIKDSPASEQIEEFEMNSGECMDIPVGLVHEIHALEDSQLFEFSTEHFDSDSHRLPKLD